MREVSMQGRGGQFIEVDNRFLVLLVRFRFLCPPRSC